ncbi:hypothetical protein EC991_000313 [Linnemannia zychae]|nr:hypothetical protein EC991_000313 [Linnemannia zychae]
MASIDKSPRQKPSQNNLGPQICPFALAASQTNSLHNSSFAQVVDERISRLQLLSPSVVLSPVQEIPASIRALEIPEIILIIQEHLDRASLLNSLRAASLWYHAGRHLVWRTIEWDNTVSTAMIEEKMVENAYRIRGLRCTFHSQGGTSYIGSSMLLKELLVDRSVGVRERTRQLQTLSLRGHFSLQPIALRVGGGTLHSNSTGTMAPAPPLLPPMFIPFCIPTLAHLEIRPTVSSAVNIHLILDTAIGLQTLIIDSHGSFVDSNRNGNSMANAVLNHVSAASLSPPSLPGQTLPSSPNPEKRHAYPVHEALMSLKIQHLKMNHQELEGVAARCPNLVEFQSVCSPATLWRQLPGSQQLEQQQQQGMESQQQQQQQPRSLVGALAKSCPRMQRFHVGLQQGGLHTDLVRDALTSFPRLISFGLPTMDCTTATMDVIKSCQLRHHSTRSPSSLASGSLKSAASSAGAVGPMRTTMGAGAFLTCLTIMNVSSNEKVSQALHEFLCWTPYLKEFYAYNTTLYLEHMQPSRTAGEVVEAQEPDAATVVEPTVTMSSGHQEQYVSRIDSSSSSNVRDAGTEHSEIAYVRVSDQGHLDTGSEEGGSESATCVNNPAANLSNGVETHFVPIAPTTPSPLTSPPTTVVTMTGCGQQTRRQQWACTGLETLVVRFAHLPWRNSAEPPKRSKETFAFMAGLQNLKRLCIKEGLMLEAGREYDMLARLRGLEEVVFTTCYPIPIKPADMEWVVAPSCHSPSASSSSPPMLKKVVVRRQKANAVLDKEMTRWFDEHDSGVQLSLQLTDCCEEEYRFA